MGGLVFRHRSATACVALAAAAALIPGTAFAAGSSAAHAKAAVPSVAAAAPTKDSAPALRTFSSPASKSIRLREPAAEASQATASRASTTATATTATTIYAAAYFDATCSNDAGAGTEADPYCSIQDAVNAAVSGDTVEILSTLEGYPSDESVTVSTSGISIVGGAGAFEVAQNGAPSFVLNGVTDVTLSGLSLHGPGQNVPAVEILDSSHVTLDSDYIVGGYAGNDQEGTAVEIDGASSDVAVTRTYLSTDYSAPSDPGAVVESGASGITFASDILAGAGISATGVDGLDVAGNTIQRGCDSGIDVEGSSTGVFLENNLIEDANPNTDYAIAGYPSQCQQVGASWDPDVTVSADSTTGTTTAYNDFYIYGTDQTAEYSWAGTSYTSLPAFRSAVGQGTADTLDPVEANDYAPGNVDANLATGSTAINSANSSAPGELATDYYGASPYTSRGAIQYNSKNPTLDVSLDVEQTSAHQVSLTAVVTSAAGYNLEPTIDWGDGTSDRESFYDNSLQVGHDYLSLGSYTITITVTDGQGDAVTNSVAVETAGTTYTAYGPTRILDTRKGIGTGGVIAPVPADGTLKLKIDGDSGIAADAQAVAANLTVTDPKAGGYLTAYPDGTSIPGSSNVNFEPGQTVANMAVVTVGADGYIDLYNHSTGTVDLVADASGYYTPTSSGSGYTSITPARFLDTRDGTGGYPSKTVTQGHPVTLKIDNRFSVPASGVSAVAVNITEATPSGGGYITAWSSGAEPSSSNLNFATGRTRAVSAIVPVSKSGTIELAFTGTGSVRLIVDVDGYYSSTGSAYVPVAPYRLFNSESPGNGALKSGWYYELEVASYGDLGPDMITGVVANTTVTDPTGSGDLVVFPNENSSSDSPVTVPTTSALNFTTEETVPNLTFTTPGFGGYEDLYNQSAGSLQVIVDVMGYFVAG